jgi:hypothetical protein
VGSLDFLVFRGSNIRRDQGFGVQGQPNTYNAAGNKFSQIATDFLNLGVYEIRYYKDPNAPREDPITVTGNVLKIDADPNSCPTIFCDPPCKEPFELFAIKSEYFVRKGEYTAAKTDYDAAVANGNTVLAGQKGYEMAYARHAMDEASFLVTLHLLYDTTTFHRDTLLAWFARMDNPAAQLQLARDYLAHGQPSQAAAVLSQAVTLFGLNDEDASGFSDVQAIVNLIGNQSVYSLDAQTLYALASYADGNGSEAALLAQNIRTMYGFYYPPIYQLPDGVGERSSEGNLEDRPKIAQELILTASPNPASGEMSFAIAGKDLEGMELVLNVTDLNGKAVWSQRLSGKDPIVNVHWNTTQVPNGIYVYRLTSQNGRYNLSGKIVVQQ